MPTKKLTDQLVDAKAILEAIAELKRRRIDAMMQELEATERDLASHVMEEMSLIHKNLTQTGATSKQIRRLIIQIESLALVSIFSLRKAQRRLWLDEPEDDLPAQCQLSPQQNPPT